MTDTKTTPAPQPCPKQKPGTLTEATHGAVAINTGSVAHPTFSSYLAHIRAADARSARRFEGL
jgi:hypothetical protein